MKRNLEYKGDRGKLFGSSSTSSLAFHDNKKVTSFRILEFSRSTVGSPRIGFRESLLDFLNQVLYFDQLSFHGVIIGKPQSCNTSCNFGVRLLLSLDHTVTMYFQKISLRSTLAALGVATAASLLVSLAWAGDLVLYDSSTSVDYYKRFTTGPAQRCYSFSCFPDLTTAATWTGIQQNALLVFFNESGCRGNHVKAEGGAATLILKGENFDNSISSAMVWESSIYPTRGLVNLCPDKIHS